MKDDFEHWADAVDALDDPMPQAFHRVFVAGRDGGEARLDAGALLAILARHAEIVDTPAGADLIVVGSAPDGPPGRVTFDASDRPLLEGSPCPVAVAPRGLAESDARELKRIDVGIDGGRGAAAALDTATRLALAHDSRLRLIAVAELDLDLGGTTLRADPRELERLSRRLTATSEGLPGIWVESELREGPPDQILVGLARDADLLALGSRATYGHAGQVVLGDIVARILRAAPCPVLVVPAP